MYLVSFWHSLSFFFLYDITCISNHLIKWLFFFFFKVIWGQSQQWTAHHALSSSKLKITITNWLKIKLIWINSPVCQLTIFAIRPRICVTKQVYEHQYWATDAVFIVIIYNDWTKKYQTRYSSTTIYYQQPITSTE